MTSIHRAVHALRWPTLAMFLGVACAASSCHTPAPAQPTGYAGTWVVTLGTRVFMVLTIEQQGDRFEARLQAPSSFGLLPAGTLPLVAVTKGDQGAAWIAAATLDRYLHAIRQPQIFGTQFLTSAPQMSQGAYNLTLASDALRIELGVPTIAAQLEQMKAAPLR